MTQALLKHKLIRNRIDYKSKDCDNTTALHYALKHGYNDIALLLIESGANVNVKDEQDYFVIHTAAAKGNLTSYSPYNMKLKKHVYFGSFSGNKNLFT